jgi:hypothetical protein
MARSLAVTATSSATATMLTLHNLCPHLVWPLVVPNSDLLSISDNKARLDLNALLSLSVLPVWPHAQAATPRHPVVKYLEPARISIDLCIEVL